MSNEESVIIEKEEFEKLTPLQKEAHIKSLKIHKSMAIKKVNNIIKSLATLGEETDVEVLMLDESKSIYKVDERPSLDNLPRIKINPKFPQIFDKTDFPKSKQ